MGQICWHRLHGGCLLFFFLSWLYGNLDKVSMADLNIFEKEGKDAEASTD